MTKEFQSPLAGDLREFLEFKRKLGYRYARVPAILCRGGQEESEATSRSDLAWMAGTPSGAPKADQHRA
jgi:hypothetical protein